MRENTYKCPVMRDIDHHNREQIEEEARTEEKEAREKAFADFEKLKEGIKKRRPINDTNKVISKIQATSPYLTTNELVSLETCLDNAAKDLQFGSNKMPGMYPAQNAHFTSPNPELGRKYEQIAAYVSHEIFDRKHPNVY